MRLKRKHQGLGYYQIEEQLQSEIEIVEYLVWLSENAKFDEKTGDSLQWASVRQIVRATRFHHRTVKKAIERLKLRGEIIEVAGTRRARLFCYVDSPTAEYIRNNLESFWSVPKLNSKIVYKRNYQFKIKIDPIRKKILDDFRKKNNGVFPTAEYMNKDKKKRHAISMKNRRKIRPKQSMKN